MMQLQPLICPRCGQPLNLEQHPQGGVWRCPQCSGVAANLAVLRRHLEEDVTRDFWFRAGQAGVPSNRHCPSCCRPLREFIAVHEQQSLPLDMCRRCQLMWFDPGELEVFPESRTVPSSESDSQVAVPSAQAGSAFGDESMDHCVNRFAGYVSVGLDVILLLLRLFR